MKNATTITAVLGPTNTGKTYLAMERMLTHTSGMMGFPLRLLARENYDKLVAIKGRAQVALITGEEQIVPDNPRYYICTVEAMPLDKPVEFLCVDEIQLAADPDRGHIFTDRIFNARGISETMFIGSDTIRHLMPKIIPGITITSRPRFSELTYTGYKKIIRLPARSAVVAFSAANVYALAEFMRRQRGGAAVVLGALSPRARNAQVGMYQSGEVDYIVATDAIGMGLNMDIDHVAFSTVEKYDGRNLRKLRASEMGQIAGRAGRYMTNGTFGTTADEGSLPEHMVEKIQGHKFDPVQIMFWRNSDLDFSSIKELQHTLNAPPPREFCKRPQGLEDQEILGVMAQDKSILHKAQGYDAVKLLWEVCQIPDYRRMDTEIHARFLMQLYHYLMQGDGQIPAEWLQEQIYKLDNYTGDMNALMTRLAHIRIWTYVSNRGQWVKDPVGLQEWTRGIEDRLSDALHLELTQRFVDKRVALLMKKLDENAEFEATVNGVGEVLVEGQHVGKLSGLRFIADHDVLSSVTKPIRVAAHKAVMSHLPAQLDKILADGAEALSLARNNEILWHGQPVGKLLRGKHILEPNIWALCDDEIGSEAKQKLRGHLDAWLEPYLRDHLGDMYRWRDLPLTGAARGVVFQLTEALGCWPTGKLRDYLPQLSPQDVEILEGSGIALGEAHVYGENLFAPRQTILRTQLYSLWHGQPTVAVQLAGKLVMERTERISGDEAWAAGFAKIQNLYVRADKLEKLIALFYTTWRAQKPVTAEKAKAILPLNPHQLASAAEYAGFTVKQLGKGGLVITGRKRKAEKRAAKPAAIDPNSPFAPLMEQIAVNEDA
jgi:ATP-dependent RNA helicase SUPV3L1/SUV3